MCLPELILFSRCYFQSIPILTAVFFSSRIISLVMHYFPSKHWQISFLKGGLQHHLSGDAHHLSGDVNHPRHRGVVPSIFWSWGWPFLSPSCRVILTRFFLFFLPVRAFNSFKRARGDIASILCLPERDRPPQASVHCGALPWSYLSGHAGGGPVPFWPCPSLGGNY